MQILNMILYTGITLGALIFIHELGHFLAAKLTGMRVDRFSIGFPPRAFGKKIGDTDYCISWIPVGGYVKIAGMIDESMDTEFLASSPQPWEFRSKPLWARIVVISAGVTMNVLLAFVIFWWISYSSGKLIKETTRIGGIIAGSAAAQAGFQRGDSVLTVNGTRVSTWDEMDNLIYLENLGDPITFDVLRNGQHVSLYSPTGVRTDSAGKPFGLIEAYAAAVIRNVEARMPAEKLGLKPGDTIISVDSVAAAYPQVVEEIRKHAGHTLLLKWKRDGVERSGTTTVTNEGRIGVSIDGIYLGPTRRVQYTIAGAFMEGWVKTGQSVYLFYLTISKVFAGKTSLRESFGGPIAIAQLATQSASYGIVSFLGFMALLSMSLAIINILPIPALDGGHLIMMLFERLFRREIPHRVKIVIQQTGFILLLLLMAFVIYNDISRF